MMQETSNVQPFFARYLEEQSLTVKTNVKAGPGNGPGGGGGGNWPPVVTLKYPSDDADEIVIPLFP